MAIRKTEKLTKAKIAAFPAPDPSGKQTIYWDTEVKGFGVLCSGKTKSKSFVVQRENAAKIPRRVIERLDLMSSEYRLEDVRENAKEWLRLIGQSTDPKTQQPSSHDITLNQALDGYLKMRKDLRPVTTSEYKAAIRRHLSNWENLPLRTITPDMVETKHQAIKADVLAKARTTNATGDATANATMRVLRLVWNYARDRDARLPENPVNRLHKAWYPDKRRDNIVNASDLPGFYQSLIKLQNSVHRDYLLLVLFTGLRRREAASLRWDDLDLIEGVIRIPASSTKAKRKLDLPMSDFICDLLASRRDVGRDGPFVFPAISESGHIEEPRFALDQAAAAIGIKVTVHDLRRTFITIAESCDISPYALKGLVNHSMGSDITGGYVIAGPERLREPMQKVADRLKELIGIDPLA